MCGIAGFFSHGNVFREDELPGMRNSIAHRGPDASGIFHEENVGLAHTRLSILDLSAAANQPMHSQCGWYVIVYNGEVYNYRELTKMINKPLKTTCDTELVLEGFAQWGTRFISMLNGMFAFVVYDRRLKQISVFRDRIGIKPLFYFWDGQNFAFASELKALRQLSFINQRKELDPLAVNEYLHLGYIPQPRTIYKNIFKFPAGHCAMIDQHMKIRPYWALKDKIHANPLTSLDEAKDRFRSELKSSVGYRLISDVPFGTFLSGGIDSSLVTAVAAQVSSEKVKTFSIGFDESRYDESDYARKVSDYLETNHHEFRVSYKEAKELIPTLIDVFDEPFADSSAVPTMIVSKLARKHVKMILSGDGGDELFMGYGAYKWAERLDNPVAKLLRKPVSTLMYHLPGRYKRISKMFDFGLHEDIRSHIFSQEQYLFSRSELKQLMQTDFYADILMDDELEKLERALSVTERQSFFDINYYLKDDLLTKVDRASMFYGLEVRVPFLDHFLIERALNLSPELKLRNGVPKYILKEVLYEYLPKEFFKRPKWGFAIPLRTWLKDDLRYLIEEGLSDEIVMKHQVVNLNEVKRVKNNFFKKGIDFYYNRLWALYILHQFLEKNE